MLICPIQSGGKCTYNCTDKCAWFRVDGGEAFCGDKLIGEILEKD